MLGRVDDRLLGLVLVCSNLLLDPYISLRLLLWVDIRLLDRQRLVWNKAFAGAIQSYNFSYTSVPPESFFNDSEMNWSESLKELTVYGHQSQIS